MFSRARKTPLAEWWWTIDRTLLGALVALILAGVLLSFAASPPVAERLGLSPWHFVIKHILFVVPALAVMIGASLATPRQARIGALVVLVGSLLLLAASLKFGVEVKGARRWVSIFGQTVQPSEFVKPAFAVLSAWFFAEQMRDKQVPGAIMSFGLLALIVGLLLMQPDIGQSALVLATWAALLFLSGIAWWIIGLLGALALGGAVLAYTVFPHVARRVDNFLNPELGGNYQVEKALQSVMEGGWFGRGPGEAMTKKMLPDAHADFVFSAAAGEFGMLFGLVLIGLIGFIVIRALGNALEQRDLFARMAASVLAIQFGLQSAINLAVNLNLMPPKGMTLPFVSYGGTSMIAIAFGMGLMLALTRKKPQDRLVTGLPNYHSALTRQGV